MITKAKTQDKYFEAVGRRKTSIARVRVTPSSGTKNVITVNDRDIKDYFLSSESKTSIKEVLEIPEMEGQKFTITIMAKGGGINSQAGAVVQGLARALTKLNAVLRKPLKKEGYLSRDPRAKERRKFGLKKARKAPQWSKR